MADHIKPAGSMLFLTLAFLLSPSPVFGHEPEPSSEVRNCSGYAYTQPFPTVAANYTPRYHTTAQQFLDDERGVGPVTPSEYAILDLVLDEARTRLTPIPEHLSEVAYERFADKSLRIIDCILVSHGFVYPGIGLVQLLSDGLDPTIFDDPRYYDALLVSPHNSGRTDFIQKRRPGPYYVVDCDIASYIYVAVGEVMNYPIAMVDLPMHNFVRWMRPDGAHIDFETMDGLETTDNYYFSRWSIPQKFTGTPGVLTTMTAQQLFAYHDFSLALSISWKHDYSGSIAEYEKSISVDATLMDATNNLAWLYTVVPTILLRDGQKAVSYAKAAVAIFPNGDSFDTLACAYGQSGNFAEAINAENQAIRIGYAPQGSDLPGDLDLLSHNRTCQDPKFGTDPRPFRPIAHVIQGILNKDANAIH